MKVQILLTAMTTVAAAFPQDDCNLGRFKGVIPDEQVNGTVDCLVRKVNALQEQTREQRKRLDAQEEAQKLEIYEVRQISDNAESRFDFSVPKGDGYYNFSTFTNDPSRTPNKIFIALHRTGSIVQFHFYLDQPFCPNMPAVDEDVTVRLGNDGTLNGSLKVFACDKEKRVGTETSKYTLIGKLKPPH
jgi:hypothetical protein